VIVKSGKLDPKDLRVEALHGPTDGEGKLADPQIQELAFTGTESGHHRFAGQVPCERSGRLGLAVRVRPARTDPGLLLETSLVRWG